MIDTVSNEAYRQYNEDVQGLDSLKGLQTQWQAPDKKIEDIWKSFRLLPMYSAYLIASHYKYNELGWSFKTKFNIYDQFDKSLHKNENPGKIGSSIASAVETQQKIVLLQKIFATLVDKSKTLQDKVNSYNALKIEHSDFYQEIMHNIGIAKGNTNLIQIEADVYAKAVIEHMLFLYRFGYPEVNVSSFKNLKIK